MVPDDIDELSNFTLDAEGVVNSWNPGAERVNGYKATQIIGQSFSRFFTEEDIRGDRPGQILRSTVASGRHREHGLRLRQDGSRVLTGVIYTVLQGPAGDLIGFCETRQECSGSPALQADYRELLEAAPDAMVVIDQSGCIIILNLQAEKQFGYRRDELLGQHVTNIIPQGFAERLIADSHRSIEDALAQQIGTGIELIGRRKDGSDFPIELMLSPLRSRAGVLITAAVRDISARKQADATLVQKVTELHHLNEELRQFAYVASHDLQEPLRMVASFTQLLSDRYKGKLDADADEFIAFAVDGANRMQRLIQDLLAYSRVGSKGVPLIDTSSDQALARSLINLRAAIDESGALVTHAPLPRVLADPMQLTQLFQNLVGNAIKYRRAGTPEIHVTAEPGLDNQWIFSVHDNGLGIEAQYLEKIFDMFQRLHTREAFSGTGIGLAICKKILQRHGGHITVESEIGRGSTFRFALAGADNAS